MAFISLGKINKKIIYAVFGGIFKLVANLAKNGISRNTEIELKNHPFILGINSGLGLSLALIPFLIFDVNYKSSNPFNPKKTRKEELIYTDTSEFYSKHKHSLLLLVALCDFLQKLLAFLYVGLKNFWIFDTLFIMIFSYFLLKQKLYLHHFVSLIFIVICGILVIVIYNLYLDKPKGFFYQVINILFVEIIFSLEFVVSKSVMQYKFCSPFGVCLFEGVFQLILNFLLLIIFTYVPFSEVYYINRTEYEGKIYIDNMFQYYSKLSAIEVISFIVSMFSRFGFTLFCLVITHFFTPSHIIIIVIIGEVFFAFDDKNPVWSIILESIVYAALIFVMLVFLEIIEVNCFGLQKNTEKNISERAIEMEAINYIDELTEEKEEE